MSLLIYPTNFKPMWSRFPEILTQYFWHQHLGHFLEENEQPIYGLSVNIIFK